MVAFVMRHVHCCGATRTLLRDGGGNYVPSIKTGDSLLPLKGLIIMFLSQLIGVLRQWRRYNQSLRELNRLGDRELADIGITRGDIPRVAWDSAEH
jgi:uncharacterized protein YjiS (DUF1127 family)